MIQGIIYKGKRLLITLRFSILTIFITLLLITSISIITITTIRFDDELSYVSGTNMNYISQEVLRHFHAGLFPSGIADEFSAHLMEQSAVLETEAQLVPYTINLLKILPLVERVFWGDQSGSYISAQREADGTITTHIFRTQPTLTHIILNRDLSGNVVKRQLTHTIGHDIRVAKWYDEAKKEKRFFWSDIHLFYPPKLGLGITAVAPILTKTGEFHGIFGLNFNLNYLSHYITDNTNQNIPNSFSFIITKDENLVAYPLRPPFTQLHTFPDKLVNVHTVSLPLIDEALDAYKATGQKQVTVKHQGQVYLVSFQPIPELARYGWLVGVVIPKGYFINSLEKANLITLLVSLAILIAGIILVSNLITRVVKPIKRLVKETDKIKRFELNSHIQIKSRIKEVVLLTNAINGMRIGLKQFQKYVPKILVRQLIEAGEDTRIGGVRKQLVIFFSDVENFTAIAEKMDANDLMAYICEYFESLSAIITAEKGTIDKYVGDSIMAFWGAPLAEANPCHHAVKAAIRCQAKLNELNAKWISEGKPALNTRIGIHVGDAIVGNLGSHERISYTAIGDTINIASRLEEINKVYKTKIIVSQAIYDVVKDSFTLRMLDCVTVRGKSEETCIYEVLSKEMHNNSFDIAAYRVPFEKGFAAYQAQEWEKAKFYFAECITIYPTDTLAPLFIKRCESLEEI